MKRSLGNVGLLDTTNCNDAVNGVQRDYACTLSLPSEMLPFGLGVITDGRIFMLVRTEMSPTIKSNWSRPFDFRVASDVTEFLPLLAHALFVAATRKYCREFVLPQFQIGGTQIKACAVVSATKNSVVVRFKRGNETSANTSSVTKPRAATTAK